MDKSANTDPLWCEVTGKCCALVWIEALAPVEELWQEGGIESMKIYSSHVVKRQSDVVLKKVVALVQENLQQHINKVEKHGTLEQFLEHTDRKS